MGNRARRLGGIADWLARRVGLHALRAGRAQWCLERCHGGLETGSGVPAPNAGPCFRQQPARQSGDDLAGQSPHLQGPAEGSPRRGCLGKEGRHSCRSTRQTAIRVSSLRVCSNDAPLCRHFPGFSRWLVRRRHSGDQPGSHRGPVLRVRLLPADCGTFAHPPPARFPVGNPEGGGIARADWRAQHHPPPGPQPRRDRDDGRRHLPRDRRQRLPSRLRTRSREARFRHRRLCLDRREHAAGLRGPQHRGRMGSLCLGRETHEAGQRGPVSSA